MNFASRFQGPGPYDLPVAQGAKVQAGTDAMTLMFRVLSSPGQIEAVNIQIPNGIALEFAAAIAQAASGLP